MITEIKMYAREVPEKENGPDKIIGKKRLQTLRIWRKI